MKITKQAQRDAKQLFRCCMVDGCLDEGRALQAVRKISELKPRGFLAILGHFKRLVELERTRRTATVESALPLSPQLQSGIKDNLAQKYGDGLTVIFREQPSLIGGLRIQIGSDVFDGSVRSRLAQLQESF